MELRTSDLRFSWRWSVTQDRRLTEMHVRVALALDHYSDPDGTNARPGAARIARELGYTRPRVTEALRALVHLGYIHKTGSFGRSRVSVYRLTMPRSVPQLEHSDTCDGVPQLEHSDTCDGVPQLEHTSVFPPEGTTPVPSGGNTTSPRPDHGPEGCSVDEVTHDRARDLFDPETNPIAWIDNELPGGFRIGERERARELLDSGEPYGRVRWALLKDRNAAKARIEARSKIAAGLSRRRLYADDARTDTHEVVTGEPI
jgi:hypothetical protein